MSDKKENFDKILEEINEAMRNFQPGEHEYIILNGVKFYPPITYYWTVPLILDHSHLFGK
jgi:hypothetical protein